VVEGSVIVSKQLRTPQILDQQRNLRSRVVLSGKVVRRWGTTTEVCRNQDHESSMGADFLSEAAWTGKGTSLWLG
jgi:hypothetical protein